MTDRDSEEGQVSLPIQDGALDLPDPNEPAIQLVRSKAPVRT